MRHSIVSVVSSPLALAWAQAYQPVVKVLIPARGDSDYFHSDNP
jgi:hypothetical protein